MILPLAAFLLLPELQAATAAAATTHPAALVAQAQQALPATTPSGLFQVSDPYYGNDNQFVSCRTAGNHTAPSNLYNLTPGSTYVVNDCNARVWLYQNSNGSGYKFCVSPGDGPINIYRPYHLVGVSTNGSRC
ncbi:MAG TPA: hypothetical protein VGI21_01840 [Streptosporangiaceae bacterium]|jgi:hypothetical protein